MDKFKRAWKLQTGGDSETVEWPLDRWHAKSLIVIMYNGYTIGFKDKNTGDFYFLAIKER